METLIVERSIWIDAPRERVWQAVSEPEQIAQWFLPPALGAELKRDADGTLVVSMFGMNVAIATFEMVSPLQQVVIRSLPEKQMATSYLLEDQNGGTQVAIRMTGFEALPEDTRQQRLAPSGMGWEKALENLKAYVKGAELPHPEGYVAALFGYRAEGVQKYAVERSIWLDASRERVWKAVTDPVQIEKWFSPGTSWRMSALEVGGRLYVPDAETGAEMYTQLIEVVDPPHLYITRSAPPELPHTTTWTLDEEDGGTRLTIKDSGYELDADDARHNAIEQNSFGFGMMLKNLEAVLEEKELPFPGGF